MEVVMMVVMTIFHCMTLKACLTSVLCLSKAMQYAIWLHVFVQLSFHDLCSVQDIIFFLVIIVIDTAQQ